MNSSTDRDLLKNADDKVVEGFGKEWSTFSYGPQHAKEVRTIFSDYFSIFPKEALTKTAIGFDAGCGSGRWAAMVAPMVGQLHCVDASREALGVSRRNLAQQSNVQFHQASAGDLPFASRSMDFGYSLGVLHHMPDTQAAVNECARVLKPGAPFLVYLYYAFDNRPAWFRAIWRVSDRVRSIICRLPFGLQAFLCNILAITVYWPLARMSRMLERAGVSVGSFPLSIYRQRSLYVMRNDALDRMATKLEKRFTATEIRQMLETAGFVDVVFSQIPPFWCAVGRIPATES